MDCTEERKRNKKSPLMKYAIKLLQDVIKDIKAGECSERELSDALMQFNPELKGYFRESDFVNYDKACIELGIGWDRNKLNALCKKYKIKNVRVNNMPVGFRLKEIRRLKEILNNIG